MNKFIVTTTIHAPTEAILKFNKISKIYDWQLIIVADKKTPYHLYEDLRLEDHIIYLDCDYQQENYKDLSDLIGWNCIQRRNIGFIEAYKRNADILASVDDDNIPKDNWGKNLLLECYVPVNLMTTNTGNCDDPIFIVSKQEREYDKNCLWHRGFPIQRIKGRNKTFINQIEVKADIQADFWNGDPDIDAIGRLIDGNHKYYSNFPEISNFPFTCKHFSPFNSQNTFIARRAIKEYFMFPSIGRMDDIWASYYIQSKGYKVIYNKPTVYQERNNHNIIEDMENEIIGYKNTEKLLDSLIIHGPDSIKNFIPERSWEAFQCYQNYFK